MLAAALTLAGSLAALYEHENPRPLRSLVNWKPLDDAKDISANTGRPLLYFFLREHDLASRRVEREILSDPERSRAINESFVAAKVLDLRNLGRKNPREVDALQIQFGVPDLPAAVIVNAAGEIRRYRLDKRLDIFLSESLSPESSRRTARAARPRNTPREDDSLARRLDLLAHIGRSHSGSFAPSGDRLAFVTDLSGDPQVWTIPTGGGWPTEVTTSEEPVGGALWSPTDNRIAFIAAGGRGAGRQIYVIDPNGTDLRRISDGSSNNWLGFWTGDGSRLMISANGRDPSAADAYLANMKSGVLDLISRNTGFGLPIDVNSDGRYVLLFRANDRIDNDLFLVDRLRGRELLLTPHKGPGKFFGQLTSDGKAAYLCSDKDRDLAAFTKIDLGDHEAKETVLVRRSDAPLENFALNRERTTAALLWNVAGRSEVWLFDLTNLTVLSRPTLPVETATDLSFSPDSRLLALTLSGPASPSDIWTLDIATGRFEQVTHSRHTGVDLTSLVRPRLVRFRGDDGIGLSAWLYHAPGQPAPGPMVVSFHGGPASQEQPEFNDEYQSLLAEGISVLAPNVRGSSGFGKKFENLDNGPLRGNAVHDIRASVEFAVASGLADPKRIGIMGTSYGGYMVMAALTTYPDLFAAAAEVSGFADFESFFAHTEASIARASAVEFGDPVSQNALLRSLSPIHAIDRIRTPLLVVHGAKDSNVPVSEADQIVKSLRQTGDRIEYLLLVDEGHSISKLSNRARVTTAKVNWFRQYLHVSTGQVQ